MPSAVAPSETRSLSRAVALLRLLGGHGQVGWRITDLSAQSGLDLATVHRLLGGLAAEGLVTRVPGTRRYALGPAAFLLGQAAAPWYDVDRIAAPSLRALAAGLGGTVFVKVRSGVESVCVARHDGAGAAPALLLEVGGRRPLCLTAGGVAMLVALPRAGQRAIEAANAPALAAQGRPVRDGVRRMLARSRRLGAGVNLGDIVPGIVALGVALPGDAPVASLTLALADAQVDEAAACTLLPRLRAAATELAPAFSRLRY